MIPGSPAAEPAIAPCRAPAPIWATTGAACWAKWPTSRAAEVADGAPQSMALLSRVTGAALAPPADDEGDAGSARRDVGFVCCIAIIHFVLQALRPVATRRMGHRRHRRITAGSPGDHN